MGTKDNTYANTGKRLYFLSDDVDNESIGQLTWNILHQLAEDDEKDKKEKDYKREPIKIYINSYGGKIYDMWGLIDIILNSKTPIYTYCTGYAMSAAFKIFWQDIKDIVTNILCSCIIRCIVGEMENIRILSKIEKKMIG